MTDSAVKQVAVGQGGASLTYDYVYDADNRRRAKVYPTGGRDEYFWTAGWQMLEDRGLRSSGYSVDEYLWLGGQPIGVRRSAFSSAWARQPQSTVDCTRVGEYVTQGCGWRHLVSNVTGRVVLAVDDAQAIAGVYEYTLSGHANRQNWWGETPHPYGASTTYNVATVDQPVRGLSEAMRLRFGMVDLEPGSDVLSVENAASTQLWSASAWHSSTLSTPWLTTTTNGPLTATVVTNSCNAPPDGGACSAYAYQGVTLESVDYLRWQSTSTPWELSLRQPGQYYDAETGLFENWNRFYDADTGRYLSPEPLLQSPAYVRRMAQGGMIVPTYAYALNNPLRYTDPNGLEVLMCERDVEIDGLQNTGAQHQWLRTGAGDVGIGECPGPMPGWGIPICTRDHSAETGRCVPRPDLDEDCINEQMLQSRYFGNFTPFNNCQSFVKDLAKMCPAELVCRQPVRLTCP